MELGIFKALWQQSSPLGIVHYEKSYLIIMCLYPLITYAQFGVNYHQSNLPFIGFNYEIADRFRPE